MQVESRTAAGGVALTEVYDASDGDIFFVDTSRLINVSALARVGSGADVLIAGFAITGGSPIQVLVRGIGPALGGFGVAGVLADPRVVIRSAGGGGGPWSNDDWGVGASAAELEAAAASVGAFALPPGGKDAAVLVTLPPGNYTAEVSGAGNGGGMALVEIYEVR